MFTTSLIHIVLWLLALPGSPQGTAQAPYRGPTRNPHGQITIPCENCHTFTSWKPIRSVPEFSHNTTRYPLRGLHEKVDCRLCHTKMVFTNVSTKCADCHADIHRRQFGANCEQCHTVKGWRVSVQAVKQHLNRFPLLGAHAALECEACHKGGATGQFAGLPTDCAACHLGSFQQAKIPDHLALKFPTTCQSCHTVDTWQGAKFDHVQFTGFLLTGAHARLDCTACHAGGRFQGTPANCYGCHAKDFNASKNPDHVKAGFPQDCSQCHSTASWSGARFDHNALTRFPLTGAHVSVSCQQCHIGGKFTGTSTDCASCHLAAYQKTTNPNHVAAGFPTDCSVCHTTAGWAGAKFDHSRARFPLTGAHVSVSCQQCHLGGKFTGTPTDCASCHLVAYQKTTNPNHVAAGFPTDCSVCHTTAGWAGAKFDHSKTKFQLTGAHLTVSCASCHVGGKYVGRDTSCSSCHLNNYNATKNPDHKAAGFPLTCAVCHTTTGWTPASFDHNRTAFPLTGAHLNVSCAQCHIGGKFTGTLKDCASCHIGAFQKATNPNHVAAGFPTTCATCHNTSGWAGARFDHNTLTKFPLSGAHLNVSCAQCHINGKFAGTPKDCASCHLATFQKTTNPNHVAAGFPTDCSICHSTAGWAGARFDHSKTKFPLTGFHVTVSCATCHVNGKYVGLDTACSSCHINNYNNTKNPDHKAAGFPLDCAVCHTTTAWTPASFDHNRTPFPLTGAHVKVACANCHIGGKYAGTPTDCYSCHKAVYTSVTNPNHVAAGFPTTCNTCHNTTSWSGATFNHTWFPIYSGVHAGKWTTCNDCHVNPSNFQVFSCVGCHAHQKTTMDQKHSGVRNYVYNSANCYACHPAGRRN
ncbi:MAG: hypothetical protein HY237_14905 [Acidobacteria bacterium]|nr:hypothetical protein [Acidobacteriota bacterium]